jgi:hypothetical protein
MIREIRIYVEGGGNDNPSRRQIRTGFGQFLDPLWQVARERRVRWEVIACGPRNAAFENFQLALRSHPDAFNVLLVDAEDEVSRTPWEHLRQRDGWLEGNLPDDHCHLMVRTVEAWIAADPTTLAGYYGQGFQPKALPTRNDIEAVDKEHLIEALNRATAATSKGRYHKIVHCSELLGKIRPEIVRKRAAHCDRLFTTLESLLAES